MRHSLSLIAAVILSGCASPQDQCLRNAAVDVVQLDSLIEETKANIDRAYGLEQVTVPRSILVNCVRNGVRTFCQDHQLVTKTKPVAIDIVAERRKLEQLETTRALKARDAQAKQKTCLETYPSD